jgi:flagellar basal body-associated protein FliL
MEKPTEAPEESHSSGDFTEINRNDKDEGQEKDNTLLIVLIISVAAIAIAAIVGFTVLKLQNSGRNK